jgi:glycerophosphoryl diester phosphodiesterase
MEAELEQRRKLVIGHRGYGCGRDDLCPENTLPAFRKAVLGDALYPPVDGFETDVQYTRDGEFVLYHDEHLDGKLLGELTLAEVRAAMPDRFAIPTLRELFEVVRQRRKRDGPFCLVLELKDRQFMQAPVARRLLEWLRASQFLELATVVSSFNHSALQHVALAAEELKLEARPRLGALFNRDNAPLPADFVARAKAAHAAEVHLRSNHVTDAVVSEAAAARLGIMTWFSGVKRVADGGVNLQKPESDEDLRRVLNWGPAVVSVCTNRPDALFAMQGRAAATRDEDDD